MAILKLKFYYKFTIFISVALLIGCGSCKMDVENEHQSLNKEAKSLPIFKIVLSSGGGFTGLSNGYSLFSNGNVEKWRQLSAVKDSVVWISQVDSSKIYNFKNDLETSGITNKTYNGTGNITTRLKYETKDSTYNWSWKGAGDESDVPLEIKPLFENIKKFCSELENYNKN